MKKKIIVLGISGSIGTSTLSIINHFPALFDLVGFSVHTNKTVAQSVQKNFPLAGILFTDTITENPLEGFSAFLREHPADIVVNGIAGSAGVWASLASVQTHQFLALANKESIVMLGEYLLDQAKKHQCTIIPVDSEHSAIYALISAFGTEAVKKIILTASGGPFRTRASEAFSTITVQEALNHPTWSMGKKISIDSATLANKALEVIEASVLFSLPPEKIEVVVHPESLVHSLIQLTNGQLYAQISPPQMTNPIFSALTHPELPPPFSPELDFSHPMAWHFEPPRLADFPLLALGFSVAKKKKAFPLAFNRANEVAVTAFLQEKISFLTIAEVVHELVETAHWDTTITSIDEMQQLDTEAEKRSQSIIQKKRKQSGVLC